MDSWNAAIETLMPSDILLFLSDQPNEQEEKLAFGQAWEFIQKSMPCVIYYFLSISVTQAQIRIHFKN